MTNGILKTRRATSRLPLVGGVVGAVAALALYMAVVMSASTEVRNASTADASATGGIAGVGLVTVTRSSEANGTSAGMSPEPAAAGLLLLPVGGWALGKWRAQDRGNSRSA